MNIRSQIESILFVSSKPLALRLLEKIFNVKKDVLIKILSELQQSYRQQNSGIELVLGNTEAQMVSSPKNSDIIKKFLKEEIVGELSRPSLETLTIIAYRGPIGKIELEQIRGVHCSLILRNLLIRGLINTQDDRTTMQKKYSVSVDFLKFLGIGAATELPEYEILSKHEAVEGLLKSQR